MNAFEEMLRMRFGFTWSFELLMVKDLEEILGPADEAKVQKLIKTLLDVETKVLPSIVVEMGETAALTYCRSLGWAAVKEMLLKAAKIIKQTQVQHPN